MRKNLRIIAATALFCLWGFAIIHMVMPGFWDELIQKEPRARESTIHYLIEDDNVPLAGPVSQNGKGINGWLSIDDGQLVNQMGEPFQLRGLSSHGITWFPQYLGYASINTTKAYGANVFRVAMYADFDPGNYSLDPNDQENNKALLYQAVDNALRADMYAIVDWHIVKTGNPMVRVKAAVTFFDEVSKKYADEPGVIYEICNEPSGGTTWADIAEYAGQVIPAIRQNSPNAIIIVGTPDHSTDLASSIASPLPFDKVMYAYHYYFEDGEEGYRKPLDEAAAIRHPVFVSEWGVGHDPNKQNVQEEAAKEFVAYLNRQGISWVNWSLSNKAEPFSAIRNDVEKLSAWTLDDLTLSGQIVFQALGQ